MDWREILDITAQVLKAHPDAHPAEQARMVQQQFRDQPALGWVLIKAAQAEGTAERHEGDNG